MSKKMKQAEVIQEEVKVGTTVEEVQPATSKKLLKNWDKVARKMDGIVTDLAELSAEARLAFEDFATTVISPKDESRMRETIEILESLSNILYHTTARMARKYSDKTIELNETGRKSLKK